MNRIIEQSSRLLITQDFQDDMSSLIRFYWCWTLLVTTLVRLSPALTGKYFYFLITVAALTFPSQEADRGDCEVGKDQIADVDDSIESKQIKIKRQMERNRSQSLFTK